ncbi:CinA family protein [Promicromonospora citrea]|uniref:Competence damage-inducible protein A n=1 Tax=Promicromonospora citrea TaxID=43677 RepID=A0A8H9L3R6_9MICO|nr:CinA family protein [Promicromonospora citrea]NNH52970.1 CinA family protein [Promicromonospora citrea]GGM21599.1 competence damage-inducible protein A [Promicromonospora citrea]
MTARDLLAAAAARGWTIGVAESLTGGRVTAALVAVPGASRVVRGGVVAYATDLKARLLGVDADLLAERGAVDEAVAAQMASGVRSATGADVGLATTGVAGPDPQDGQPPGVVFVAASTPVVTEVHRLDLTGDRPAVIEGAVRGVLELASALVSEPRGENFDTPRSDLREVTDK